MGSVYSVHDPKINKNWLINSLHRVTQIKQCRFTFLLVTNEGICNFQITSKFSLVLPPDQTGALNNEIYAHA